MQNSKNPYDASQGGAKELKRIREISEKLKHIRTKDEFKTSPHDCSKRPGIRSK